MATVWDADILIWAATQLTEARDRGAETSPNLRFFPYDLLKAIRRGTSGQDYRDLSSGLTRLDGRLVRTNIRATEKRKTAVFHWLEGWNEIIDEVKQESKGMTMTLPQWLYHGVLQQGGVLTIDPDSFLLTGGLEPWMYRVCRKHAGHPETGGQFTMRQLYEKSRSPARCSAFAIDTRQIGKG